MSPIVYLVFRQVWTSHTDMSLRNLIRMLFGTDFLEIIGVTLVISKVRLFDDTSDFKGTVIRNLCVRVALCLLARGLFAREDRINVPHLSKLYFLYSMLESDRIDPRSFLVNQVYSIATSSAHRIVIRGLITPITRMVAAEPNIDDRVTGLERLNLAAVEQMKFCKVNGRRICWIYPGNRLMPLPHADCISLVNRANLYLLPGDEELARPTPRPYPRASSSSKASSSLDFSNMDATLRSIQEE